MATDTGMRSEHRGGPNRDRRSPSARPARKRRDGRIHAGGGNRRLTP